MPKIDLTPLRPGAAVDFFRSKGFKVSDHWSEVWREEHAHAFTVARAAGYDLLADIRGEVDKAIEGGLTVKQFQAALEPRLRARGWWGRTQDGVQLGSPRRLEIIYDTNLRMAHSAGRWERIERLADRRPFLRYRAVGDNRTRPQHMAWHDIVLPWDHPFWRTHYPPNGWRCRCSVQQLSQRDLDRRGLTVAPDPAIPTRQWVHPATGKPVQVPEGIDPGFDYNVGQARMRALTPPPVDGGAMQPPRRVVRPEDLPPLPPPRPAPESRLMPRGLPDTDYVDAFLGEFGATRQKPAVWIDKAGEPLVVGPEMFIDRSDPANIRWKAKKSGREVNTLVVADTLRDPDEIWIQWVQDPRGAWRMIRRYLGVWEMQSGKDRRAMTNWMVGYSPRGWTGVTAFAPLRVAGFQRQRAGVLLYRRP